MTCAMCGRKDVTLVDDLCPDCHMENWKRLLEPARLNPGDTVRIIKRGVYFRVVGVIDAAYDTALGDVEYWVCVRLPNTPDPRFNHPFGRSDLQFIKRA